jgi:integrase/recombinase XerD
MKTKIKLNRMLHRGQSRLAILFDYDGKIISILRRSISVTWSNTNMCWYSDDTEENLRKILYLFRDIADLDISAIGTKVDLRVPVMNKGSDDHPDSVTLNKSVNLVYDFPGSTKDRNPGQREIIKSTGLRKYDPVEFRINEKDGHLAIRFTGLYDQAWIDEIKSFGRVRYDGFRKVFYLPWAQITVDSLADYFSLLGVRVNVIKAEVTTEKKQIRKEFGDEIRKRELNDKSKEALVLMQNDLCGLRYSGRTNETYLALLELFFKYYHRKDPLEITNNEVSFFIHDFIINNGYSASYQNQIISAIKYFYIISGTETIDFKVFERPRRNRSLPKVFSKDEVKRILNSVRNNKHKALLWLIYSCGLRRSEVTNIRLTDLDRDRGIIHIREGKGRVDRIVPVSEKVWEKLDEYIDGYTPLVYLFEGQGGGRYSSESVYRVFKQALQRTGIKKDVGVHSLRHSYATHLHESGLDIRYIQELLGHKSTRTTEIYTHVSRRNLVAVRSPIDDIDVK